MLIRLGVVRVDGIRLGVVRVDGGYKTRQQYGLPYKYFVITYSVLGQERMGGLINTPSQSRPDYS